MSTMVNVEELHYTFADGTTALRGVSLQIQRGSKVAVLGPNGAGKSTLLLHLNAIYLPQSGKVCIDGVAVSPQTEHEIRRKVGLVFQDPDDQVFSPTVWEDVCFGPLNLDLPPAVVAERAQAALAAVGMLSYREHAPQRLSYGLKKRVAIAGVLAMQPDVIAIDEPMAFLDPESQVMLVDTLEALRARGTTLIICTHDVDWAAEWADAVVILCAGQVLAQGPPDLLTDRERVHRARLRTPLLTELFRRAYGQNSGPLPFKLDQAVALLRDRPRTPR